MNRFRRACGFVAALSFGLMVFGCETLPMLILALLLVVFGAAMYFGGFMYGIFYPATYGRRYRQPKRITAPTVGAVRAAKG